MRVILQGPGRPIVSSSGASYRRGERSGHDSIFAHGVVARLSSARLPQASGSFEDWALHRAWLVALRAYVPPPLGDPPHRRGERRRNGPRRACRYGTRMPCPMARSRSWTTEKPWSSSRAGLSDSVREDRKKDGDQLLSEEDLNRLPTDRELARLQRTTVLVS